MGDQTKNSQNPFASGDALRELGEIDTLKDFAQVMREGIPESPKLQQMFARAMIVGWQLGVSTGRWEALENPNKAMQAEIADLYKGGITESELGAAIEKAKAVACK